MSEQNVNIMFSVVSLCGNLPKNMGINGRTIMSDNTNDKPLTKQFVCTINYKTGKHEVNYV